MNDSIDIHNYLKETLTPLIPEELLYKEYHIIPKDVASLEAFRLKHESSPCYRSLYLPELSGRTLTDFYEESTFWYNIGNVIISRNFRYSPVFEHTHDFFEICYMFSGTCVNTIEGMPINMHENDLFILPPGIKHSIAVFDDSILLNILIRKSTFRDTFFNLLAGQNVLSNFFNTILDSQSLNNYILINIADDQMLINTIETLAFEIFNRDAITPELSDHLAAVIFSYIIRNHTDKIIFPCNESRTHVLTGKVIAYLYKNYKTATLKSISSAFSYSDSYMSKLIKQTTGMTFSHVIMQIRIDSACKMLSKTQIPIEQICLDCGYDSLSHFYNVFKKTTGMLPAAYRREYNTKAQIK